MLSLPDTEKSFWREAYPDTFIYPPLREDKSVDVVIVGGGITGLTTAYLLKKAGLSVMVLEKNTVGGGTSGNTTGKVTAQHGLNYYDLNKHIGKKQAGMYAQANQMAIERMEHIIQNEHIACNWERDDNYVFTTDPKQINSFKTEAKTAAEHGLPATFETQLPLPFKVQAAVKFANQAKFNVQKYLLGLARLVDGNGNYVFENSNVVSIHDGEPIVIKTKVATVTAKNAIIATKIPPFPLLARFSYGLLEYPHTSYLLAGHLQSQLKGMYISPDKEHYSILPVKNGKEQLLLIGGEEHIPGLGKSYKRHQKLAAYAERYFNIRSIAFRWKAMDYLAYDNVPLIGKVYPWSKHLYTATGFKKWGLSTSMVASIILHDLVLGQLNTWAQTFDSLRLRPVRRMPHAIAHYLANKI